MAALKTLADVIEAGSAFSGFSVKTVISTIALIVAASTAFISAKPIVELPVKMAHHDSTTQRMADAISHQLCIQVADHRKMDWRLCYTSPNDVLPVTH